MKYNLKQYYDEVYNMIVRGYSKKEIAIAFGVSKQAIYNLINMDPKILCERILAEEQEKKYVYSIVGQVEYLIEKGYAREKIQDLFSMSYKQLHEIWERYKVFKSKEIDMIVNPLADRIYNLRKDGMSKYNIHKEVGISLKRIYEIMELENIQ